MRNLIGTKLGLALAVTLGSFFRPDAPAVNFNPTPRGGRKYPFSSTRQHRRHARAQINARQPNGRVTLMTLPSYLRRPDFEVDMILKGERKIGTVE